MSKAEFDTLTNLAAHICNSQVAVITLADTDEPNFKIVAGLSEDDPENHTLEQYLKTFMHHSSGVVIKDLTKESEIESISFQGNRIISIVRVPFLVSDHAVVGSLFILDNKPPALNGQQLRSLELLGKQITLLLDRQKSQQTLENRYGSLQAIEKKTEQDKINYEALINNTSDDIWSIDTAYRLISFNRAFADKMKLFTGKKVTSGQYALFPEKIPADMHYRFKSFFDRALSGESFIEEYSRPDKLDYGMEIWIELNGHPIYQQGQITGAAFFARTITTRKHAELKTRQSEENYRMLFESSPVPILLLDMESMQIRKANTAALYKYAYTKEEVQGKNITMLLDAESTPRFLQFVAEFKKKGENTLLKDITHRKKNGAVLQGEMLVHELSYEGKDCLLTIFNDQTEQLKSISIKTQMARILENSLNEIYIFDTENLRFLYVNRGALLNIGYSMNELAAMSPYDIKPEFDEPQFRKHIQPLLYNKKEKLVFITQHRRKDGSIYPVEAHLQKMPYEGQPAIVAIIIDITDTKAAESKLHELNQLLEKSNDELEQFASITAHDMLEPLRMISGFTSLLERKYAEKLDAKGKEYLRFATDGSIRMQRMIKDILDYSRTTTGPREFEPFSLSDMLDDVLNDLQVQIKARNASIQVPDLDVTIYGHKQGIYRLFLNLISNGLKFVPRDKKPEISVLVEQDKEHDQFTVVDNGIGIDSDSIPMLFKPYSRLSNRNEVDGTGLGLATCKKIVDYHGGKIWVTSVPEVGSRFHFFLPRAKV
nr:PAS domain S-box protein [Cytophagales bacterium]